jgi:hypothetical protein
MPITALAKARFAFLYVNVLSNFIVFPRPMDSPDGDIITK